LNVPVFSIDHRGIAVPELPATPDGSVVLTAQQASELTGESVEDLNRRWIALLGELLNPTAGSGDVAAPADVDPAKLQAARTDVLAVLREQHFPKLLDDADVLAVMRYAGMRNLDVAAGHVWAEVRWDYDLQRERLFVGVCAEGLRAMAHATGLYAGLDDVTWGESDKGALLWARATVYRRLRKGSKHREPYTVTVNLENYYPGPGFWDGREKMMLAKCARAAVLREAFPAELGGLMDREELARTFAGSIAGESKGPRGPRRPPSESEPRGEEVSDRTQFETLLATEFKATDGKRRGEVIQQLRNQFPHLANGEPAAFWTRAWRAVKLAPQLYGLKLPAADGAAAGG
jgi:hypothetical protein